MSHGAGTVRPGRPALLQTLGLWDVVLMNIVAVVGLRWVARGARAGAPSVTLWLLACLAFFLPHALAVMRLSSRYPEQGGLYAWTYRALGPFHGFVAGWCLWVNNLFYFPSLLLFAAANVLPALGPGFVALAEDRTYSVAFVLVALWLCVGINLLGFRVGRWLQNAGAVGTWIPATLLIGAGAIAGVTFGSATSFAPAELVPREDVFSTLSLWSAMCFAFAGFEITSLVSEEVKHPRRTVPLGVAIAGLLVAVIYIVGSASVLVAVPTAELAERSGIADAVTVVGSRLGLPALGGLTGALLALGAFAGTSSWFASAARVPFAAGLDRVLPASLARLHPRYRTPHVAIFVQGLAATAIFLASVFLTLAGGRTSVQESYDILVNLTILVYFVPYVYLFIAFARLELLQPGAVDADAAFRIRGGRAGTWAVALVGGGATLVALGLVFVPPTGTENVVNYEANLVLQAAVVLGVGAALYRRARREAPA